MLAHTEAELPSCNRKARKRPRVEVDESEPSPPHTNEKEGKTKRANETEGKKKKANEKKGKKRAQ